jgi:hypothetical protein
MSSLDSDFLEQLSNEEIYENLEYFKENYWRNATIVTHLDFLNKIHSFRRNNGGMFPTKKQFYLMFRNDCYCRYYISDEDMYIRTADFYMRNTGDLSTLSCSNVYYFSEFYVIERREPINLGELNLYMYNTLLSVIAPDFFDTGIELRPVEKTKIEELKDKIFIFTYSFKGYEIKEEEKEICSICQDNIEDSQKCIRLECGHYFHADDTNCCENGNIFNWFKHNNICPMCRKEV